MALNAKDKTKTSVNSKEEYTTNKVLFVVAVCMFGILYLMVLKRLLSYGTTFKLGYNLVRGIGVVSVVGAYLGVLKKRNWT